MSFTATTSERVTCTSSPFSSSSPFFSPLVSLSPSSSSISPRTQDAFSSDWSFGSLSASELVCPLSTSTPISDSYSFEWTQDKFVPDFPLPEDEDWHSLMVDFDRSNLESSSKPQVDIKPAALQLNSDTREESQPDIKKRKREPEVIDLSGEEEQPQSKHRYEDKERCTPSPGAAIRKSVAHCQCCYCMVRSQPFNQQISTWEEPSNPSDDQFNQRNHSPFYQVRGQRSSNPQYHLQQKKDDVLLREPGLPNRLTRDLPSGRSKKSCASSLSNGQEKNVLRDPIQEFLSDSFCDLYSSSEDICSSVSVQKNQKQTDYCLMFDCQKCLQKIRYADLARHVREVHRRKLRLPEKEEDFLDNLESLWVLQHYQIFLLSSGRTEVNQKVIEEGKKRQLVIKPVVSESRSSSQRYE